MSLDQNQATESSQSSGVEAFVKDHLALLVFGGLGAIVLFLALHIAVFIIVCRRTKFLKRRRSSKSKTSSGSALKRNLLQDSDNDSVISELAQRRRRSLSGRVLVRDESKAERNKTKCEQNSERRHHRKSRKHPDSRGRGEVPVDSNRAATHEELFNDRRRDGFNKESTRSKSPKHKSSRPTARILPTSRTRLLSSSVHSDNMFRPSPSKNPSHKISVKVLPLGPPPIIPAPAPSVTGQPVHAPIGYHKQSQIRHSEHAQHTLNAPPPQSLSIAQHAPPQSTTSFRLPEHISAPPPLVSSAPPAPSQLVPNAPGLPPSMNLAPPAQPPVSFTQGQPQPISAPPPLNSAPPAPPPLSAPMAPAPPQPPPLVTTGAPPPPLISSAPTQPTQAPPVPQNPTLAPPVPPQPALAPPVPPQPTQVPQIPPQPTLAPPIPPQPTLAPPVPPQPRFAPPPPINPPPPPPPPTGLPPPPPPPSVGVSPAPRAVLKATPRNKAPARQLSHGDALKAAIAARRARIGSSTSLNNNNSEPDRKLMVGSLAHIFPGIFSPQKQPF